ncbi:MAG: DUF4135 domain-containing protein, partial [Woeseiaceae bacterium]|nr:DUF4135 domain-containing protein [Woeseiaceae bacterium]
MTNELAAWVRSRVTAPATLDEELFSESGQADLVALLAGAVRDVASAVADHVTPGILVSYPVLENCLDTLGTQWQDMSQELGLRLKSDLPELVRCFNGGQTLGRVVHIHGETGDRHRHGRQVITLQFESGLSIVYKPRDVGPDEAFGEFLNWLTESASLPAYRTPAIIRCAGYGWTEFIEARPARTTSHQEMLWRRIGGLLA